MSTRRGVAVAVAAGVRLVTFARTAVAGGGVGVPVAARGVPVCNVARLVLRT
jgi:hypothetical protein